MKHEAAEKQVLAQAPASESNFTEPFLIVELNEEELEEAIGQLQERAPVSAKTTPGDGEIP